MDNSVRGEYFLDLDKKRQWKITMNEEASIESVLAVRRGERMSFEKFVSECSSWTSEDYRLLLWAGLRKYDKELTEEAAGELMVGSKSMEFRAIVLDWAMSRYPESAKKKLEEVLSRVPQSQRPRQNSPGTNA